MSRIVENVTEEKFVVLTKADGVNCVVRLGVGQGISSSTATAVVFDTQAEALAHVSSNAIDITKGLEELPPVGQPVLGDAFYKHGERIVYSRQEHVRTEHTPEDVPALFYFVRENPEGLVWIAQEMVSVGNTREWEGVMYEALQDHVTQDGWEPPNAPALWKVVSSGVSVWVQPTGGHDAYNTGDEVMFPDAEGTHYRSLIDANVWSPAVYPAGWEEVV